jgi:hypothetical protein
MNAGRPWQQCALTLMLGESFLPNTWVVQTSIMAGQQEQS